MSDSEDQEYHPLNQRQWPNHAFALANDVDWAKNPFTNIPIIINEEEDE